MTPEEAAREAAELDTSSNVYPNGLPKYHRHFAGSEIHQDAKCPTPALRRIRVYVFDAEDLDAHEAYITTRLTKEFADRLSAALKG